MIVKRGDIYYADLRPVVGSGTGWSAAFLLYKMIWATVIARRLFVRQLQARYIKAKLPTHVALDAHKYGIVKDSVILLEQVRTIDKS